MSGRSRAFNDFMGYATMGLARDEQIDGANSARSRWTMGGRQKRIKASTKRLFMPLFCWIIRIRRRTKFCQAGGIRGLTNAQLKSAKGSEREEA